MKYRLGTGILLFCFFSLALQSLGFGSPETKEKEYDWKGKLKRGAINIVTSPVEIAREIQITTEEKNLLNGWTLGLVKGLGQGLIRFGAGVLDVLTCPFNFPDSQKGPLIEPEFVWQKSGVKYS